MLSECGYPADVVVLDFETYFDSTYSFTKMSTVEYVQHPLYEELGKAFVRYRGGQPLDTTLTSFFRGGNNAPIEMLQALYGQNLERVTLVAHNAAFDGLILRKKYGINAPYFIDLLGLARYDNSRAPNDLDALCKRHGLPPKGDTKEFAGLRCASMTPEQWESLCLYTENDVQREWDLFQILLPRLSRPSFELWLMRHTLELFWNPRIAVDFNFGEDLAIKMLDQVQVAASAAGATDPAELSGTNSFLARLKATLEAAGDSVDRFTKINKRGQVIPAVAKTDDKLEELLTHPDPGVRTLAKARQAIKSWPTHAGRVRAIMAQARANDGLLAVPLRYCGAHTHRWSGGEKINLQNLSSRGHDLMTSIRHVLVARPGRSFVITDASQIEARVLAAIAGQEDLCELFRNGQDVYLEFASKIAGVPLRKARDDDPPVLKKYYKRMRDMGKIGVLGGGYGMGATRGQAYASASFGMDITLVESEVITQSYRKSVPMITQFWRDLERTFKFVSQYHEARELRELKFHWESEEDATVITLPSGATLKYRRVRVVRGEKNREQLVMPDPTTRAMIPMWGGYLTENIVQSVSRDILAEAIKKSEDAGYPVVLHAHDEEVCDVPDEQAQACLDFSIKTLSTPPSWASHYPLGAEGVIAKHYQK